LNLIAETKEAKNLSVLLASSDHSYPSKLKRRGLQNAFSNIIFADEFPPKEMKALLTKCGLGCHLIDMCMSVCGEKPNVGQRKLHGKTNCLGRRNSHQILEDQNQI
jgi:hypothetical protein